MNYRKVWKIAQILLISQLRASASNRNMRSFVRRPFVLIVLAIGIFTGTDIIGYIISYYTIGTPFALILKNFLTGAMVTIPSIVLATFLVLGLVLEVSGVSQAAASDTINWLPVSASEYVLGSILMFLALYAIAPAFLLGMTMSLSYFYGDFSEWELAAILSILGMLVSSSVLEIIRAVLNRFSSTFYKRGGRGAVAARAFFGVLVIVIFQVLFYPTFYERILGSITANLGPAWFIPVLWSSVSMAALFSGQLFLSTSFAVLFAFLSGITFFFAVQARTKYWVPMPSSVRISSGVYSPTSGSTFLGFLNPAQLAITRKDLRGLVRRREMVRTLSMPFVFLVSAFLAISRSSFAGFYYFGFFMITITTLFISMAALGSEGKSILNLYQFPLSANDYIIGKAATPAIFGSLFAIGFFLIIGILNGTQPVYLAMLVTGGVLLVVEMTSLGMLLGTKFPYYAESARATFMSLSGVVVGFPVSLLTAGISIAPFAYTRIFGLGFQEVATGFGVSVLIAIVFTLVYYKLAVRQARHILSQIPGTD